MSAQGGRKKDFVWCFFTEMPPTERNKGSRVKCKHCNKEMQGLVARMKAHLQKSAACKNSNSVGLNQDEDVVVRIEENQEIENEVISESTDDDLDSQVVGGPSRGTSSGLHNPSRPNVSTTSPASNFTASSGLESKKRKINTFTDAKSLDSYVIKTSKEQKMKLDMQIARSIYATNTPFRAVEHPEYKLAIEMLRPGYNPPNRNDVGNKLLEQAYGEQLQESGKDLKNKTVCMSLDGWSNIHNEPVVCVSVTTSDSTTYLTDTIDTSGHAHTSEYLEGVAKKAIFDCQEKFGCLVGSLVTDNTNNVKKMREDLLKDDTINVIAYGCSAHLMHLLAKDMDIPNVKNHVVAIVKYFRNNHLASAAYRATGSRALPIPQDIRWNTVADCLETYIKNWPTIMQICEENRHKVDSDIRSKVANIGIKRNAEDLLKKLKPISVALDRLQRDSCSIGVAVDICERLEKDLTASGVMTENDKKNLQKRLKQALTPAHFLANILTPAYMGKDLKEEEYESAMDWANENYPDIVPVLINYKAKAKPFPPYMFRDNVVRNVHSLEWWTSQKDRLNKNVIDVATQLLTATASTADVERVFSSFGLVQSKLRNRLGLEKAGKLVFLFKAMNQYDQTGEKNKK